MLDIEAPGAADARMTGGSLADRAEEDGSAPASRPLASVTAFPFITENPYQSVLYRELAGHGLQLVPTGHFKLGWLWRARKHVDVLHFHWPQNYYRWWRSGSTWSPLSWLKMGVFLARLLASRVLGYTIIWTIHEVYPHERATAGLDPGRRNAAGQVLRPAARPRPRNCGAGPRGARDRFRPPARRASWLVRRQYIPTADPARWFGRKSRSRRRPSRFCASGICAPTRASSSCSKRSRSLLGPTCAS